jgi:hypothetical protein
MHRWKVPVFKGFKGVTVREMRTDVVISGNSAWAPSPRVFLGPPRATERRLGNLRPLGAAGLRLNDFIGPVCGTWPQRKHPLPRSWTKNQETECKEEAFDTTNKSLLRIDFCAHRRWGGDDTKRCCRHPVKRGKFTGAGTNHQHLASAGQF